MSGVSHNQERGSEVYNSPIKDMANQTLERIDCTQGGAQEAFHARCCELETQGWILEPRHYDWRYANREGKRIQISIDVTEPAPHHSTW